MVRFIIIKLSKCKINIKIIYIPIWLDLLFMTIGDTLQTE